MELVFRQDAYERACEAVVVSAVDGAIRLDRTVFYPTGGGQPGDIGHLSLPDGGRVEIVDTIKGDTLDDVVHVPKPGSSLPAPGSRVRVEIDWDRRHRLMRMHTCLHLLCAVVPGEVTGGQVGDGKGRLDFNLPDTRLDKEAITAAINKLIEEDHSVEPRWISDDELVRNPDLVRTMSVKPPMGEGKVRVLDIKGVDLQPCGGTHVRRTGEIGQIEVTKIENKGKMNRRVNVAFKA
jgi:misacylated tRNA(Ala) deacylase